MALLAALLTQVVPARAQAPGAANVGGEVFSDFKYLANNAADDTIDIATAPLHLKELGRPLSSPRFYLVLGAAGAIWGGSYALDQTMRSHLRPMSSSNADLLEDMSYGSPRRAQRRRRWRGRSCCWGRQSAAAQDQASGGLRR